jgi:hypothetical protein
MDIDIGEVQSSVRAVDDKTLLTPHVLQRIVALVVREVELRDRHRRRVDDERRVSGGVASDLDGER